MLIVIVSAPLAQNPMLYAVFLYKMENNIDVSRYGFELNKKLDSGSLFYCRKFNDDFSVELMVAENVYTLSAWHRDNNLMVANRYKLSSQEQLDFIIFNGRVGSWFDVKS